MQSDVVTDHPAEPVAAAATAERGNFWEVTYRQNSPVPADWKLTKTALETDTGKTAVLVTTAEGGERAVNLKSKKFDGCDINHFEISDSSFSDCEFVDCRFIKAHFREVKFSRCTFDRCHFHIARFTQCQFIGCRFSGISASAEHLEFVETSLSADAFVSALTTNLEHLPQTVSRQLQEHRFLAAKTKIARAVFLSVRNEPELDQIFDATRCFEVALQRQRIAEATWTIDSSGRKLRSQTLASRTFIRPARILTLIMLRAAGFLTDWGQSPAKSAWILALAVPMFSLAYSLLGEPPWAAVLRALDCTFVFGYTHYMATRGTPSGLDWLTFINALVGFSWYALLIPALSKRIFR